MRVVRLTHPMPVAGEASNEERLRAEISTRVSMRLTVCCAVKGEWVMGEEAEWRQRPLA